MNIPVLFRTYESRQTPLNCKIWEAARATSAAPTFFKPIKLGRTQNQPFIDGGLGRNNPSQLVLEEAEALFGDRQLCCFVSIGTGQADVITLQSSGVLQRLIPADIVEALRAIATDCEATHQDMAGRFANLPDVYFRLNVEQGMQGIRLSEWEKLDTVEAHTMQYMRRNETNGKLATLVKTVKVSRGQLPIEQLGTKYSICKHKIVTDVDAFESVAPKHPSTSIQHFNKHKLCPLPVLTFVGRKDILDQMSKYFDLGCQSQHMFVLYGLGGSGKSQIAYKFLKDSQASNDKRYVLSNYQIIVFYYLQY